MRKPTQVKEVLAYHDELEWARCACNLVRKFGVSDSLSLIQSIGEVLSVLQGIQDITSGILGRKESLLDIFQRLVPASMLNRKAFQIIDQVDICIPLADLLMNVGGEVVDAVRQLELNKFLQKKHDFLFAEGEKVVGRVQGMQLELAALQQLIQFMEGCAAVAISDTRDLEADLFARDVPPLMLFDKVFGHLRRVIVANIARVGDEIWVVYDDESNFVNVLRRIGGVWQAPVRLVQGNFPNISFDGSFVRVSFTLNNKLQQLRFLPRELGFFAAPYQLWDCVRISGSSVPRTVFEAQISCTEAIRSSGINFISFPTGGQGIWPITRVTTNADFTRLDWTALTTQFHTTRYRVFRNNIQILDTTATSYVDFLLVASDYWVVGVFTDLLGQVHVGCRSNVIRTPDSLPRAFARENLSPLFGNAISRVGVQDFFVVFETQPRETVVSYGAGHWFAVSTYDPIWNTEPRETLVMFGSGTFRPAITSFFGGVIQ